jgi:hypothetical membrane protein
MLTVMAMLLYAGGTFRDPSTQHYLFLRNFLSDLGMPTSWGGHANRLGALLFVSGEVVFASALIAFSVALISLCSSSPGQRRWARAAAVAGVAAGVGFIGAALTPADRFLQLHVQSALLAFGGVFVAALFLSVILARDHVAAQKGVFVAAVPRSITSVRRRGGVAAEPWANAGRGLTRTNREEKPGRIKGPPRWQKHS